MEGAYEVGGEDAPPLVHELRGLLPKRTWRKSHIFLEEGDSQCDFKRVTLQVLDCAWNEVAQKEAVC
jgi:hypothetical protein